MTANCDPNYFLSCLFYFVCCYCVIENVLTSILGRAMTFSINILQEWVSLFSCPKSFHPYSVYFVHCKHTSHTLLRTTKGYWMDNSVVDTFSNPHTRKHCTEFPISGGGTQGSRAWRFDTGRKIPQHTLLENQYSWPHKCHSWAGHGGPDLPLVYTRGVSDKPLDSANPASLTQARQVNDR